MSCNQCGQSRCSCSSCSSVPFYAQADVCPEDNCEKIYQAQFDFAVCPSVGWNVPSCGNTSILSVPGLAGASIGSYIWSAVYGYFEITSIDATRGLLGVTNNCTAGNAAPGTQIPACTCFVVTVPPVDTGDQSGNCLVLSFTAPEEDLPLDITLTSTTGITASNTIQIGSGFYFVEAVKPGGIITIVNKGQGAIPGTPVLGGKDSSGNYLNCVSIISNNPCDATAENTGKILICDGEGLQVPLAGAGEVGYVPTDIDGNGTVEMRPMAVPPICTRTTVAVDVTAGNATYTIAVADSSSWVVGDILTIAGLGTNRFTITGLPDATHVTGDFFPVPTVNFTIDSGTLICTITCCEQLQIDVSGITSQNAYQTVGDPKGSGTFNTVSSVNGNIANSAVFTNTSTNTLKFIATVEYLWAGQFDADPSAYSNYILSYVSQYATVVGPIGTTVAPAPVTDATAPLAESFIDMLLTGTARFLWNFGRSHSHQIIGSIPAGNELRVSARAVLGILYAIGGLGVNYTNIDCKITTLIITT